MNFNRGDVVVWYWPEKKGKGELQVLAFPLLAMPEDFKWRLGRFGIVLGIEKSSAPWYVVLIGSQKIRAGSGFLRLDKR